MKNYNRISVTLAVVGICLAAASGAYAQISTINSAVINSRVFNDMPSATGNYINAYPGSITLGETGAFRSTSGGLDRDYWEFSNNGSSYYVFGAGDTSFTASMTLDVTGTTAFDNEAGWIIPNGNTAGFGQGNGTFGGGDMQFLADPNSGFLGFFGGPGFWNSGFTYVAGTTVTMKMQYFQTGSTGNMIFSVTDGSSTSVSPLESWTGNLAGDLLGGYYQIGNGGTAPGASGQAVYGNISITSVVPEPSTLALLGLGILPLARLLRRRA
jgi:hypothetical protein